MPAHFTLLLDALDAGDHDVHTLRWAISAASNLPRPLVDRIYDRLGVDLLYVYGCSENFTVLTTDAGEIRRGSVGRRVFTGPEGTPPDGTIAVLDPAGGGPLPAGAVGELAFGAARPVRYWKDPDAATDGWYRTGDLGRVDPDGTVYVMGRLKELVNRGGLHVSPSEVETAVRLHPGVADSAVVATPDPVLGEAICACVVPSGEAPPDLGALREFLAPVLARHKLPDELCLVDTIPRTKIGKVDRPALARRGAGGRAPARAAAAAVTAGDELSIAALVDEVAARCGPWPAEIPFLANLELLVESCRRTGALNATGRRVLRSVALRHLRNLRYLQDHVDAHPDVARRPLGTPVVVTGLPRTGTTLLHNLLALDPEARVLRFWEALHPVPPHAGGPPAEALQAQAQRWLDGFYDLVPDFRAIHAATPTGPEECDALLQNTFASQHFDDMFDAQEYSAWLAGAPLAGEYAHYALQLRVLSAPAGTWTLKSPSHLGHLDALVGALPGCAVVVCHRHPCEAVASYASLIHTLRRAYSDTVSAEAVGRQALQRAATSMERALDARAAAPSTTFVDVAYGDLVRDPVDAVGAVYRRLGRESRR